MPPAPKSQTTLLHADPQRGVQCLRHAGIEITPSSRTDLLAKLRAGEITGPLQVEAVTYIQRVAPNRNFSRFAKGSLRTTASSFKGQPVLVNHAHRDVDKRIGTILASKAIRNDAGDIEFHQTLEIVKAWGIEGFLDGTLDRFSIAWHGGDVTCSVHKGSFWGPEACACWPGDELDGKIVEAVWANSVGIEVSPVNVPAVVGTDVREIRAALEALGAGNRGAQPPRSNSMDPKELRKKLGLPETATDVEVLAALDGQNTKLAAAEESARAAAIDKLDALIAVAHADGRLAIARDSAGKQIPSALESSLRELAKKDGSSAESMLAALPKAHPNGSGGALGAQGKAATPPTPATAPSPILQNPHLEEMMPMLGLTEKDVLDYGPQNRARVKKDAPVPPHLASIFRTRFHTPARG